MSVDIDFGFPIHRSEVQQQPFAIFQSRSAESPAIPKDAVSFDTLANTAQ
jgi:hypothetical protein